MNSTIEREITAPAKPARPAPLLLKRRVSAGEVEQRFPRGRSKAVTVEVRRRASPIRAWRAAETDLSPTPKQEDHTPAKVAPVAPGQSFVREAGAGSRLTEVERAARTRAIEQAWKEERARQAQIETEKQQRAEATARQQAEELRRQAEARHESEERARLALEQAKRFGAEARARAGDETTKGAAEREEARGQAKRVKKAPAPRDDRTGRRERRLSITTALDEDERVRSLASVRRQREKLRAGAAAPAVQKVIRDVVVPETITVRDLALRMAEPAGAVVKALFKMGERATLNDTIDADTAELLVAEFGHRVKRTAAAADVDAGPQATKDDDEELRPRPPVITVMGHVDHGKTSLLDALRETDVAAHEAGGITQHIGAYQVKLASGEAITLIDTPGHAAFSEMRARGANLTDIVVLVVAADDGVMQQTVEAIRHAQAAEVPIVVAINKTDLLGADPQRVKRELLNHGIAVEEMGGEVLAVEVSAKTRRNLDRLLETILLQAELLELRANPARSAEGVVVEAKLDRGRGPLATLLVQRGTLRTGDAVVAGCEWGRVRALINERGQPIEQAGPSTPAEVMGLSDAPNAGDRFAVVESEARAREISATRQAARRAADLAGSGRRTLQDMLARIKEGETKELPVVIKADVQGSVEAITGSLRRLAHDEVALRVLHAAVGGINESDVSLAGASEAAIIGFNVRPTPQARELAKRRGVEVRTYGVIYELVEDVRAALSDLLAPARQERVLGHAEVRQVFKVTGAGTVAGCMVTEGLVRRGAGVRLIRDAVVVHDGRIQTLRRFKDDVSEVKAGYECGIALGSHQDVRVGDRLECYTVEEVARSLPAAA
jgi:translation initiation factor IF-2